MADALDEDDALAFGRTTTAFRQVTCHRDHPCLARFPDGIRTRIAASVASPARMADAQHGLTVGRKARRSFGGNLAVLQWARAQAAHGTGGRALMRLKAVTSRCCSGRALRAAHGTSGRDRRLKASPRGAAVARAQAAHEREHVRSVAHGAIARCCRGARSGLSMGRNTCANAAGAAILNCCRAHAQAARGRGDVRSCG